VGEAVRSSERRSRLYSVDLIASVITHLGEKIAALKEEERVLYVDPRRHSNTAASDKFTLRECFQRCGRTEDNAYSQLLKSLDPESEHVLLVQLQKSGYATL